MKTGTEKGKKIGKIEPIMQKTSKNAVFSRAGSTDCILSKIGYGVVYQIFNYF